MQCKEISSRQAVECSAARLLYLPNCLALKGLLP
jgi:hypothetical protein